MRVAELAKTVQLGLAVRDRARRPGAPISALAGGGMLQVVAGRKRMRHAPTLLPPHFQPERDPLATITVSAAPVVLEGRYRLLTQALWELRHSRRTRWGVGLGSAAFMLLLTFLAVRHFATTSWPLSRGKPGLLVAAGLLLLFAQALKAFGSPTASGPPRLRL
jgi:hypothetical protein